MSDLPSDYLDRLNLRELVARIERQQEETRKFVAEQHKLMAERDKLAAEARKLDRDRAMAPWQVAVVTAGGIAGLIAALVTAVKSAGWL